MVCGQATPTDRSMPVAPISDDWIQAATTLSRLGGDVATKSRSLWNDILP